MSGQGNAALYRSVGAPRHPGGAVGSEDSSILRYIKTLTSHQTNAKQQRLDRYLQQVKHAPESKPLQFPVKATGVRQDAVKTFKAPAEAAPQQQLLPSERKAKNARSMKGGIGSSKNEGRVGAKRRQEGGEQHHQRKKPKRVASANKKNTVGSLDRFLLNGVGSFEKTQVGERAHRDDGNAARSAAKVPAASEAAQHVAMSWAPSQLAAANPKAPKPFSTRAAAAELPLKPFNAVPVVKGPWGKPLPTCETQQEAVAGTLAADQDVAAVYEPLTFLMESIYF